MDRGMIWQAISTGGRIAFSNEENIFEDAKLVDPVLVVAMPSVWNRLYPKYLELLKTNPNDCFEILSKSLGKNLIQVSTGGAPISPEIFELMKKLFKCNVTNEYGTTEVPGISSNGIIRDGVAVKLVDVPELGYTSQDKPFPRYPIYFSQIGEKFGAKVQP
jgi:fatty acid CoA ligase FadD9